MARMAMWPQWVVAVGWCLALPCLGQVPACSVKKAPEEMIEGKPFVIEIQRDVPASLGPVKLWCELKGVDNVVVESKSKVVSGSGLESFEFLAPSGLPAGVAMLAIWMGEVWSASICPIIHTERIPVITGEEEQKRRAQARSAEEVLSRLKYARDPRCNVALLGGDLPGLDPVLLTSMKEMLENLGLPVTELSPEEVANSFILSADRFDLLVLASAGATPVSCASAIQRFLSRGGDLLALDAPGFVRTLCKVDGRYLLAEEAQKRLAEAPASKRFLSFRNTDASHWMRSANDEKFPLLADIQQGHEDSKASCLHVKIGNFTGWDGLISPDLALRFSPDAPLIAFWAKGGPRTDALAMEIRERDGSRWIATVDLKEDWTRTVLDAEDFKFWKDCLAPSRGREGDHLKLENASMVGVGLAMTHTDLPQGPHEFWIEDLWAAKDPLPDRVWDQGPLPAIEGLSPIYKFFPCRDVATWHSPWFGDPAPWRDVDVKGAGVFSTHPRPQGAGYLKSRRARWISLMEVKSPSQDHRGDPAVLFLGLEEKPQGRSLLASFAIPGQDFYKTPRVQEMLATLTDRMVNSAFLFEAGSEFYAYFQDAKQVRFGGTVVHPGRAGDRDVTLSFSVLSKRHAEIVVQKEMPLSLHPGEQKTTEFLWSPSAGLDPRGYEVRVELRSEGQIIDSLRHEILVWTPPRNPLFITACDGEFQLKGRRWAAHGVNYMPSSGMGTEDGEAFEFWMDARAYDPEVVERDLTRIAAMKMNMVSVFIYHRSCQAMNLLDLLCRCESHGLKVNLSMRPGTPMDFRWDEMKEIIETYRIPEQTSVFAYDLAWEPVHGNHEARKRWDADWIRWIESKFGAVKAAESQWGCELPREANQITHPTDVQVSTEGPWRPMVLSYRQFLNELLRENYGRARDLVRSVDPNHLVSFRMNIAGDPTAWPSQGLAYEFEGLVGAVDMFCPEGYGRIGPWDRVKDGCFTAALARLADPGLPVMWAEFGMSTWDGRLNESNPKRMDEAGQFYRDFYEMILLSRANGSACWFYPGGYRVGENSDFGIIHPDGTLRPVSREIMDYSKKISRKRLFRKAPGELMLPSEDFASGIFGLYAAVKEPFWKETHKTIPRLVRPTSLSSRAVY